MRVRVVTPWFPDYANASSGAFVGSQVDHLQRAGHMVSVDVPQLFPAPSGKVPPRVIDSMHRLARSHPESLYNTSDLATYIPTPVPASSGPLDRAAAFEIGLALKRKHLSDYADLTHAHLGIPTGLACFQLGDQPLVITEHQSNLREILAERACAEAYAELVERADAFICVSRTLKNTLLEALGNNLAEQISVVPNIVDIEKIPFIERTEHSFARWVFVGRLVAEKGIRKLARAFLAYLRNVDPNAHLTLIGTGPLEPWIRRFFADHHAEDKLDLVGQQTHDRIGSYLAEEDIFIHLSTFETFGIASLEAIAAGIPVISLRNGGAEESWGDIEHLCGTLLDETADIEDIVLAVADLRGRPGRLDLRQARSIVEQRFSGQRVAEKLTMLYEKVAD